VCLDSALLVNQLNGRWKVKAEHLKPLHRCKSHQGWFRSWRRAMGGWWPRAECLR
jgi:hypothetical protein